MRRRQIYAQRALEAKEAAEAARNSIALVDLTPEGFMGGPLVLDEGMTPNPTPVVVKFPTGTCQKCGKVIGKGRAMHEKHCKGP